MQEDNQARQECEQTLKNMGFIGEDGQFERGKCHISFIGDMIRLSINIPGVDKEYIGPRLPSGEELERFVLRNCISEE